MEIKKADSKGRVSGFEPGAHYVFHRHIGHFHKLQTEFSPTPERDLLKEITGATDEEIERFGGMGRAEEAEMLLNQAMAKKNGRDNASPQ